MIVDEARGGRGQVVLETPRTITDECRGLVYRMDFAKIFHGDLKATRRESKLLQRVDGTRNIPNPVRNNRIRKYS